MKQRTFFLVYQAGLANVYEVDCANLSTFGRNAKRLIQGAFTTCESFARGLAAGGHIVHSAYCNQAGDIANSCWSDSLDDAPFNDKFNPVRQVKLIEG